MFRETPDFCSRLHSFFRSSHWFPIEIILWLPERKNSIKNRLDYTFLTINVWALLDNGWIFRSIFIKIIEILNLWSKKVPYLAIHHCAKAEKTKSTLNMIFEHLSLQIDLYLSRFKKIISKYFMKLLTFW